MLTTQEKIQFGMIDAHEIPPQNGEPWRNGAAITELMGTKWEHYSPTYRVLNEISLLAERASDGLLKNAAARATA